MTTSTTQLTRIRDDLWQTRTDTPFPGLTTHAYLWRGPRGNVLFYSPATEADFDAIDALGGVSAQYLSHLDEAGPNLKRIEERFGRGLHAPEAEVGAIAEHARVDVAIGSVRHVDANGVEALPTPGHSSGSTSYLVMGVTGERYLFTGDTMFPTASGTWATFLVPGRGDAAQLRESVELLGTVAPDLVISSAFGGETAWMTVDSRSWAECVAQALATVPS
ncbi:MBL fold metallo-hydrolase [Mycolicibacterium novocastrense]|uniref:MBL fold metallo-hydrolase n=1 Tax=Mycolicibacterium novocastrense TaxID=59813 RepID=UPI0007486271|nr:MBL fold metallo-hydrolase [Mycolicibacterium novocastrense]KUH75127.1 MBL fold metallo-hydrolase [Mycolicibacterium novocastrense]KUH77197.1 MBL fold metallo-hydrolase [Mycolicibacterium novocastrense]KUH77510.1 MBL fold metallo-hydrolase [Mycolicibacterium novocastrense]